MSHHQDLPPAAGAESPTGLGASAAGESAALSGLLQQGLLQPVDATNVDSFLAGQGLKVLFFAGSKSHRRDAHDVAVALREVLKDYRGSVSAGLVSADEAGLQPRFRILVLPSLVLVLGGEILEIVPRVRDWVDYLQVFQRYLGPPGSVPATEAQA